MTTPKRRILSFVFTVLCFKKPLLMTIDKLTFWCCSLTKKVVFWDLLPNERYIAAEIYIYRRWVVIGVKVTTWHYEHILITL